VLALRVHGSHGVPDRFVGGGVEVVWGEGLCELVECCGGVECRADDVGFSLGVGEFAHGVFLGGGMGISAVWRAGCGCENELGAVAASSGDGPSPQEVGTLVP
jgi:hypothetical protein